ncbi:MAG TPA: hypothetical protein VGS20_03810 [Candidatus Acidoferrales bacterium]|nr:hypothetical protein [Candidatus Acidoferrales bacterium]
MRHAMMAALVAAVALGSGARPRGGARADRPPQNGRELPVALVSAITVEPGEVHLATKRTGPVAVITVQVFHQPVNSPQSADLEVGTCSTTPPTRVEITYAPPSQRITIPASPQGTVDAKARVDSAAVGSGSEVRVMVCATLSHPSSGVRTVDAGPDRPQAPLTLKYP